MPNEPAGKPITIKLDRQRGEAIRQYIKETPTIRVGRRRIKRIRLTQAELIDRALRCYWLAQRSPEGAQAVNIADRFPDEPLAAYIEDEDKP